VTLSAAIVFLGGVIYLKHHGHEIVHLETFHGEPETLKSPRGIVHGALAGSGSAIIELGLLLLIATPVARVAFSAVAFALERDYLYVVITLIVLVVLLYSLFWSSA
jgi:uncharacterized membrane protein